MRGDKLDGHSYFSNVGESVIRKHRFKVNDKTIKGDLGGNFFTQRVMGGLNELSEVSA